MKLTASTTTPTSTPCPQVGPTVEGYRIQARGPGSSPGILHSRCLPGYAANLGLHRLPRLPEGLRAGAECLDGYRFDPVARLRRFGPKQVGFQYPVGANPTLPGLVSVYRPRVHC